MDAPDDLVISDTRIWLERAVIGLNLCPFAKGVHVKQQIHYRVSAANGPQELLRDLRTELLDLVAQPADVRDTTLLIAPGCLGDFLDFNEFLADADQLLVELELEGVLQIAAFHPNFQFAGTAADDIGNCTNRSPYPTLHLLREDSIERAVQAIPEAQDIYEQNIRTLKALGIAGWVALGVGPTETLPQDGTPPGAKS